MCNTYVECDGASPPFFVKSRAEGKVISEESPVKSSGSNGVVERGVQGLEGHIRALYLALQDRLGCPVDARERIIAFIPESTVVDGATCNTLYIHTIS